MIQSEVTIDMYRQLCMDRQRQETEYLVTKKILEMKVIHAQKMLPPSEEKLN